MIRTRRETGVGGARLAILALAAVATAGPAANGAGAEGQADNSQAIEEILVVAHKHARARRDVAATVSVLSSDDLRFELGNSMADAFRYLPGVDFENAGTRFGSESINIRGISGNRVAILVDGVPISDHFGVGSFSNATRDLVSAGFVDQVEVLHGPASALYGSAAIGGVVAVRTVDPTSAAGSGGRLVTNWRGGDSSYQATALHGISGERFSFLTGISARSGNQPDAAAAGASIDTAKTRSEAGLLKVGMKDARGNTARANLYVRNGSVRSAYASILGSGRFRNNTALEGDDDYETFLASLEYEFNSPSRLVDDGVLRAYAQGSRITQKTRDERGLATRPVTIDRRFLFDQQTTGVEINLFRELTAATVDHQLGFGFEYRQRETEEFRDGLETGLDDGLVSNVLLGEVFPLRDFPLSTTTEWGAYIEDSISSGRWSLIAALRLDGYDMQPRVDTMYADDYPFTTPVAIAETEISPKAGLIYRLAPSTEVFIQYAHGFRAPPYQDANISLELPQFNVRAVPNPALQSERSHGIDAGLRWRGVRSTANVSVFRTEYDDFIESKVRIGMDPDSGRILFQSQNIRAAVIEGIEAGVTADLARLQRGLSLDAALFIARSKNRDNGEPLNSVGPPQAVVGVTWQPVSERWKTSLRVTLTDGWSERDSSSGDLFEPPGHAVFDLFLGWQPNPRVTLRGGVMNLSDQAYWSWNDVGGFDADDPMIPNLSRPGRSVSLGLDVHW